MEFTAEKQGRVDKLLAEALPQYSRAALSKLFTMSLVWLNGELVQPGHKVREGAMIKVDLSPLTQEQQVIDLPVLYEDDNIVVVNKPTGIISHARGKYWYEPSVASFVRSKVVDLGGDRAGIVHRLDRATSGVMICAKNHDTLSFLQKQFSERTVKKQYTAITSKAPDLPEAIIDAPIGRNPLKPQVFRVHQEGKTAQTHYKVISVNETTGACMIELTPKTGRTHQLRIHLAHIGCPIIGDTLYSGEENDRLLLHAHKLEITVPDGTQKTFTAPLPQEFEDAGK